MRTLTSRWRTALAAALLFAGLIPAEAAAESLFVYLPTQGSARSMQSALQKALPGHEITVFGRARDFQRGLTETPPDAAIAIKPVLEAHGLRVHLQGTAGGSTTEAYLLLAPEGTDASAMAGKVVGTIDLMGRSQTEKYVSVLVGEGSVSLKRVSETGDLLPLLQFEAADVILLPERAVSGLMASTEMTLIPAPLSSPDVELPAISFASDSARAALESALMSIDATTKSKLGVDAWTAL